MHYTHTHMYNTYKYIYCIILYMHGILINPNIKH